MGNEWFTPKKYIDAAREVMGSIDLDPASCIQANQVVKAGCWYGLQENGLEQSWFGNVWLNPPYGRINPEKTGQTISYQLLFGQKALREYQAGRIEQAVLLLLGNACFMKWFQPFWQYPLCFHSGRVGFGTPDGSIDHFGFGTTFVYLGPHEQKFIDVFSKFGRIVKAIDTPQSNHVIPASLWDSEVSA